MLADRAFFPDELPPGYAWLEHEPVFDPAKDLQLSEPAFTRSLSDLGYPASFQEKLVSPLGITAPFQVLSASGLAKLREVIGLLQPFVRYNPVTRRVPAVMRGSVFRSRFIRDFSLDPTVTDFFSRLASTPLRPTLFNHQLAHLNFPPDDLEKEVNSWHYDVNSMVMVLMVHDPNKTKGGEFEYFDGPRWEGREFLSKGSPPDDRLVRPQFPGAGWAVLMQGCAVLHHARTLDEPGERNSLVTSFDSLDVSHPDPNRFYFVTGGFGSSNPNALLERQCRYTEWARYQAWRCRAKLGTLMETVPYTENRVAIATLMKDAISEMQNAIEAIERGDVTREEAIALRAAADQAIEPN
jgi:hypothetical protein